MKLSIYDDIRKIYENSLIGEPDFPTSSHGQKPLTQSDISYRKYGLPGATPGSHNSPTTPIPEMEEDEVVSWNHVQSTINNYINNLEPGMTYAERALKQLLIDLKPKYNT